jgi:adenosylmethionine-8-amino-7-oxononanoate aminotransferase
MPSVRGSELTIVRGEGCWIWTDRGEKLFDTTASLWYCNVGHGRTPIAEAVFDQMRSLEAYHTFGPFSNEPANALAARLQALAPIEDGRIFLTSGGSDSIETAAKLARRFWTLRGQPHKQLLISRENAYHGLHAFGTGLAGMAVNREGYGGELVTGTARVEAHSDVALEALIDAVGPDQIAAFFCEPVIGTGGIIPPPPGYLEAVRELCRVNDILFVADEVITGFGRLGDVFGCQRFGISPDMLVFAKGVTSGYLPLGGVVVAPEIWRPFWDGADAPIFRHGLTYSGHPAACAAARANLDIVEAEDLAGRVRELEPTLAALTSPLADHSAVVDVRTIGLLAGVQLRDFDLASRVAAAAPEAGLVLRALPDATLQISPPLIVDADELEQAVHAISGLIARHE